MRSGTPTAIANRGLMTSHRPSRGQDASPAPTMTPAVTNHGSSAGRR